MFKIKLTINEFIEKANNVHNNKYDYSLVDYKTNKTKVIIICPIHGEFEQTPNNHLHGYSCIECSGKFKISTDEFIKKANIIHNNKYDYYKTEYINSYTKLKIICPIHGEFEQMPYSHLKTKGCIKCSGYFSNYNIFINKANDIHNKKYNYSLVDYKTNKTKVIIICPIHGEFKQTPHNHLHGTGCPKCNSSKGEIKIEKFLIKNNINYITQKTFNDCIGKKRKLPFDFYLPEKNLIIEFDGKQHYKQVNFFGCSDKDAKKSYLNLKETDKIKNEYCKKNNIKLIRISFKEKNIDEFLIKILLDI